MKNIKLLFILLLFVFSCNENTKPTQINYIVELINCDGTISETIIATSVIYYSSGEMRINLINGGKIDYVGRSKSTKQSGNNKKN